MRRVGPAIALFFLSPLVAEFLLGDFPITLLPLVLLLAPMYGGGALVIREVVRRSGRRWPSIVLLALAYGVLEEGVTTMSLFNPDYVDAHLLDQGFVPALGIAVPWTIFVLTLHTVWSISVPIALVEEWTPRRTTPWLRTPGFVIACVLLAVGCVSTTASTYGNEHYLAAWPKLLAVAVVVIALIAAAFALPGRTGVAVPGEAAPARPRRAAVAIAGEVAFARRRRAVFARPGRGGDVNPGGRLAPSPWLVLVVALVAGALFFLTDWWPVWWGVAAMIVALAGVGVAVGLWSRRAGWGRWHRLAAAAGGLLTYAWHGFTMNPLTGGGPVVTPVSHAIFALAVVALLWFELRSLRRRAPATELPAVSDRAGEHASTGDPARSE